MKAVSGGVAVLAAATSVLAMPSAMRVGDQLLAATSCGVRDSLWIEHYAVALYLPGEAPAADELVDPARPKALRMRIIDPRLMPPEIPPKWREPMRRHLDAPALARAQQVYRALRPGDRLTLAYQPGEGIALRINRRLVGTAPGHGLIDAILETWADGKPLRAKLRRTIARNPCGPGDAPESAGTVDADRDAGTSLAYSIAPS